LEQQFSVAVALLTLNETSLWDTAADHAADVRRQGGRPPTIRTIDFGRSDFSNRWAR
jgi:hypothetical protein